MRVRRLVVLAAIGVLVLGGCLLFAGYEGVGPFAAIGTEEHQPEFVQELGEHGDPLVVLIGFAWAQDGYCPGQFHVSAVESATEVRVGMVTTPSHVTGFCAGVGTLDGRAWADLRLAAPLGDRRVVRDSDGVPLPFVVRGG